MNCHVMGEKTPPALARRIKAARAYSGLSRLQLGNLVGRSGEQIGRYERGDWTTDPPGRAIIEAIARHTAVPEWFLDEGFPAGDAATRFADAARREAERTRGRYDSTPEAPHDEDAGGASQ